MIAPVRSEEEWRGHVRRGGVAAGFGGTFAGSTARGCPSDSSAGYVEAYPRSRANFMAASAIHQWTLDEIENLAQVVESGDCPMRTYRGQYGDAVEDPHNPELTAFASYISANLFEARQMAPFLFQRGGGKGIPHTQALLELFERTIQEVIAYNCELFAASVKTPGVLLRTWEMTQGMVSSPAADTPAKRYLGIEGPAPEGPQGVAVGVAPEGDPREGAASRRRRRGRRCRPARARSARSHRGRQDHGETPASSLSVRTR